MRVLAPLILLVLALLAAIALDRPLPPADLVIIESADCYTLDPQRMSYQQELRRARVLYEPLLNLRATDCATVPGVAKSWEVSDDRLTYVFHLRDDAKWSNGDPVTSGDFAYSWRRAIMPDTAADYSGLFMNVRGAHAFHARRTAALKEYAKNPAARTQADADALLRESFADFRDNVGIETPDAQTFVVHLEHPVAYFLDICSFPCLAPVHPATVEKFVSLNAQSGRIIQRHGWTKPGFIVTNGAYVPTVWRYKRDMRLEANPFYWRRDEVVAKSIECRTIENPNTAVLSFESGAGDWLPDVGPVYKAEMLMQRRAYLERFKAEYEAGVALGRTHDDIVGALPEPRDGERRDVRGINAFGTDFFSFNCRPTLTGGKPNPFHDARVRRAFALAVDKQALVDRVTRLGERVASTLVPLGSIAGYPEVHGLGFDPALAMRDMWKRELGVPAECRGKDSKLYKDDLKQGNFMIARGGWYGDYGDPTTWLDLQRKGNGNNDRGYDNPRFDAMIDAAEAETDPAKRLQALARCEEWLFTEELPILPLCNYVTVYMYDPARLGGISEHPRLEQDLTKLTRRDGVVPAAPAKDSQR